ncbi:unnamed protein product [Fraxinus pennsylvanica]|uniref:SPX domain-containing protein n=1 Tax=Fraxinus pennsylvanica TaxID=56036 RepID=A0AAD2E7C6_9LAMI|nr:unnamed protein product [Fraxinus pennsylvanica]
MKFGKEFGIHLEETLPEWRDKYLCYKPLKKLLKNIPAADPPKDGDGLAAQLPSAELHDWFVGILNEELEKFNDFFVDKEEEFIIRFQELKERIERVKEEGSRDGVFRSDTEFSEEMMDIRRDFVAIHGEMVLLKNYSSLNFAGLLKILKKYDKRTGGLLRLPFTQLAVHQPFFTTEPLTRLVHECEENLELLFPLEAEVVESTSVAQDQMDTVPSNSSNDCLETTLSLGEETVDIYRSTLAAMRAIKGLKKASSTCNPLSFSSLFGNLDNDNTGTVTAANSPCDSFATLQNGDEANEDVADAPK